MLVLPSVKKQIELGEDLSRDEGTKSFEGYAGDSYLGVLRMDVDGLGKRFITGFDSIKDYKSFSKRLVDFFENEIKKFDLNMNTKILSMSFMLAATICLLWDDGTRR